MINVSRLEYTYPNNKAPTVRQINFEIGDGEVFGFLGPSGAGKSTTQKVLIWLLKQFRGAVSVMGKPLTNWGVDYYSHVGVGFEKRTVRVEYLNDQMQTANFELDGLGHNEALKCSG